MSDPIHAHFMSLANLANLTLPANKTMVCMLDLSDAGWDVHQISLSRAEQLRAARLVQARHRVRFMRCRAGLRYILAQLTGESAASLEFETGRYGKPALQNTSSTLCFNVSHTDDIALIVLSDQPVGIDIERVKADRDVDGLAKMICHPAEFEAYLQQPGDLARRTFFYRLWTYKEAYCKAVGIGLQQELSAVRVSRIDGSGFRGVLVEPAGAATASWQLAPLDEVLLAIQQRHPEWLLEADFAAALCQSDASRHWQTVWIDPGML